MGLLEQMRSGTDSTGMQIMFGLVVVAFVGFYVQPQGDRAGVIATVNGERIMDTEFARSYRNELQLAERNAQRTLSDTEQKALRERVRQSLIESEVLLQEAARMGLEVSDREVAQTLLGFEHLRDVDGTFSETAYERFIKRQQFTRSDFEARLRDDLLRTKLLQLVYMGASLSDSAMREDYISDATRLDIDLVRVRPAAFVDDIAITDDERASWIAENDARIREVYDRDRERLYEHPDSVHLRMIRLPIAEDGSDKAAQERQLRLLRDDIEAGASFKELANQWSQDPSAADGGDLGMRPIAQLSQEVADALEGVSDGDLTGVLSTDADTRLFQLVARQDAHVQALVDVQTDIATELMRTDRLPEMARSYAEDTLLPAWQEAEGELDASLLDAQGLSVRPTGPIPLRANGMPFGPPQELLDDASVAASGAVLPQVYDDGSTYFVAKLRSRIEPDMTEFDDRRQQLREQYLAASRMEFYQSWVADLKSRAAIE